MPRRERSSARGARLTPTAPRSTRRPGGTPSSRPRPRPAAWTTSPRSRWAGSSTGWCASTRAAPSYAPRCSGTTPGPAARPPTWSPSWAAGCGAAAWAEAVGSVPVASFTVTKLRWLADHEPDTRPAPPRSACPTTTSPGGWRSLLARRPGHRPRGRERYRLLVAVRGRYRDDLFELALGRDAIKPRVLGAGRGGREDRRRAGARPRQRRQRRGRAGARGPARRRRRLHRYVGRRLRGRRTAGARRVRHRGRLRRRDRTVPAAGRDPQRRSGPGCRRADPGCRPRRAVPPRPVRAGWRGRPGPGALPRGRTHPQPPGCHRRRARAPVGHVDPGPPGPGGGRGDAVRPGGRRGRGRGAGCRGRPADPDRGRSAVGGRAPRSRRRSSGCP